MEESLATKNALTLTVTIFGCWAFRMVLISLKEVIGKPSFSFSIFNRFKATISSEKNKWIKEEHNLTAGSLALFPISPLNGAWSVSKPHKSIFFKKKIQKFTAWVQETGLQTANRFLISEPQRTRWKNFQKYWRPGLHKWMMVITF